MKQHDIDAWIVTSADPHQSEYPATHWKTRTWLSGFTGSAGTLVVTSAKAGLWTDFRYFLQAEQELEGSGITLFKMKMPGVPTYTQWLADELAEQATVGFDGNVLSVEQVEELKTVLISKNIHLRYQQDLVAQFWQDRPLIPVKPVFLLDDKFTGESRVSKLSRIREKIREYGAQAHLISTLDDIAWLYNLRGSDIDYNPVAISYAYISEKEARLFIAPEKLSHKVKETLGHDGTVFSDYNEIFPFLQSLPEGTTVLIDPQRTSQNIQEAICQSGQVIEGQNIVVPMKAVKNEMELEGIRQAHIRDGAAMVKWLYWLHQHIGEEGYTEITIVEPLAELRSRGEYFRGLSFNTIAGYQANGALCHYAADPKTALSIKPEGILLVDSGAQYLDGTTDITRTLALSKSTPEQQRDFTLVLKGHIALATAIFPQGTTGSQLDTFARAALWQYGLNYGHGTGHGIGHFLGVHEGPQGIRQENTVPFEPGMLCSNEPGLYREGQYGIRIENLIITTIAEKTEFGMFYQFETVTLCPIDLELIEVDLLTDIEKEWLNTYHQKVYTTLSPFLTEAEQLWLRHNTQEI